MSMSVTDWAILSIIFTVFGLGFLAACLYGPEEWWCKSNKEWQSFYEEFDVRKFGAKGDGTDDTAAIQAALTSGSALSWSRRPNDD